MGVPAARCRTNPCGCAAHAAGALRVLVLKAVDRLSCGVISADKTHEMKNRLFCTLAGLMALSAVPASAGSIYSVFYDDRFGVIDDSSGAFTQIGTLPIAQSGGIAYDNGTLYAQSIQSELISIDPVSGASSVIGTSGLQLTSVGFAGGY